MAKEEAGRVTYHALRQRTPLRTRPNRIAGIFDVRAGDDCAVGAEEGAADAEVGVGAFLERNGEICRG